MRVLCLAAFVGVALSAPAGVHRGHASHFANAKSFLDTNSNQSPQGTTHHNGVNDTDCSHVYCKIETHKCFYNPQTHHGTAFGNTISVCRDFAQEQICHHADRKNVESACAITPGCTWFNNECGDPMVRGHGYDSFPAAFGHAAGADCSNLPQMWAGTNRHNQGILSDYSAHHAQYGDTPFGGSWYRAQTCQGGATDTHYSIRTFHHNSETTCAAWGHKCGIGIKTNAFKCECRACTANEPGCVQDPSGSPDSALNNSPNAALSYTKTNGVATASFTHQHTSTNNYHNYV